MTEETARNEKPTNLKSKTRWAALYIMTFREEDQEKSNLLDSLMSFEESMLIWRSVHPRMVDRMIGTRTGTGGSSGSVYLDRTREVE